MKFALFGLSRRFNAVAGFTTDVGVVQPTPLLSIFPLSYYDPQRVALFLDPFSCHKTELGATWLRLVDHKKMR